MATLKNSKTNWGRLALASLLGCLVLSCVTRAQIDALIWKGDSAEVGIVRDVTCRNGKPGCTEFMPANSATFDLMRCMTKDDLDKVIERALRNCTDPKPQNNLDLLLLKGQL